MVEPVMESQVKPVPPVSGGGGFLNVQKIIGSLGIQPGMSVADFGSGSGYFSIPLARQVGPEGKVFALDIQESALEIVRAKAKAMGLANLEAVRGNLEVSGGSTLGDNSQDIVFMANILFQSAKAQDIIREAKRVLKSGGRLLIVEWRKGAGGIGLPDHMRVDEQTVKQTIVQEGLSFVTGLDAGQFHYGLVFKK